MEKPSGKELIDNVLSAEGITLEMLAEQLGYAVRTLKGVRYGEVDLSDKLRVRLERRLQESGSKTVSLFEEPSIYGAKALPPSKTEEELIALMAELLEDMRTASQVKRRWLAGQIRALGEELDSLTSGRGPKLREDKTKI